MNTFFYGTDFSEWPRTCQKRKELKIFYEHKLHRIRLFHNFKVINPLLKYRWATAYKSNLHAIPNASLAEAAQASMKASNEMNISLVDSIYADISDSAGLDTKWKNRLLGEHCRGRGPSSLELEDRYELRQIDRPNRYVVEKSYQVDDLMDDDSDLPPVISTQKRKQCARLPASSLPNVKKNTITLLG